MGDTAAETETVSKATETESAVARTERTNYSDGSYSIDNYDSDGNRIKSENYDGDGTLMGYAVFSYDGNGNEIKCESYNGDNTL